MDSYAAQLPMASGGASSTSISHGGLGDSGMYKAQFLRWWEERGKVEKQRGKLIRKALQKLTGPM